MEIVIIAILILINGFLSMSEMAVVSARKSKLETESRQGNKKSQRALTLANNPDDFFSTLQIGITLIGILTGLFSGEAFAGDLSEVLSRWFPSIESYSFGISKAIIVIFVTYLTLVFGELFPKRLGLSKAESIAKFIARPMIVLSKICYPLVWVLAKSSSFVAGLFGLNKVKDAPVTEEEIKNMMKESLEDGEIEEVEHDIVERAFNLSDRKISSIMTHRSEIIFLDINEDKQSLQQKIEANVYNTYPVIDKDVDNILGFVHLKHIFASINKNNFSLGNILSKVSYFPESISVYSALEQFKNERIKSGLIIDEFGSVVGIVSLKDIMEALVGEMLDENETGDIVEREDGSYIIDGRYSYYDFLAYFDKEELFTDDCKFNTISGLIMETLHNIPQEGQIMEWEGFRLEIIDMDGVRIDKVLVSKL